jgi:hypothetical protein
MPQRFPYRDPPARLPGSPTGEWSSRDFFRYRLSRSFVKACIARSETDRLAKLVFDGTTTCQTHIANAVPIRDRVAASRKNSLFVFCLVCVLDFLCRFGVFFFLFFLWCLGRSRVCLPGFVFRAFLVLVVVFLVARLVFSVGSSCFIY